MQPPNEGNPLPTPVSALRLKTAAPRGDAALPQPTPPVSQSVVVPVPPPFHPVPSTAATSGKIKIPPKRKVTKKKVDAEVMAHPAIRTLDPHNPFQATLIAATLSKDLSPPPVTPAPEPSGSVSAPSAESTPTPAHRRRPLPSHGQNPQQNLPPEGGVLAPTPAPIKRLDSAPPTLGTATQETGGVSDPPTPEEYTWPKDGLSVHGNSSTDTVQILVRNCNHPHKNERDANPHS